MICDRGARDVPRSHITGAAIAYHGRRDLQRKMRRALVPQIISKSARKKAIFIARSIVLMAAWEPLIWPLDHILVNFGPSWGPNS